MKISVVAGLPTEPLHSDRRSPRKQGDLRLPNEATGFCLWKLLSRSMPPWARIPSMRHSQTRLGMVRFANDRKMIAFNSFLAISLVRHLTRL